MNTLTYAQRAHIIAALLEGGSIRATCRMTRVAISRTSRIHEPDLGPVAGDEEPTRSSKRDAVTQAGVVAPHEDQGEDVAAPGVADGRWKWTPSKMKRDCHCSVNPTLTPPMTRRRSS